jgi:hypothetical protein
LAKWSDQDEKDFASWKEKLIPVTLPSLKAKFDAMIEE